jgi:superfamily II DNA or RNA helicase
VDKPATLPPLRGYQRKDFASICAEFRNGTSAVCYQLATGGGKTRIFIEVILQVVANGGRVLILVHRAEIREQVEDALIAANVPHGVIAAGFPATADALVQVASVFTAVNRLNRIGKFDFIVVDECHHSTANTWQTILAAFSDARVLGTTATPQLLDGTGLDGIFDKLICGPSVAWLIENGFLSPFTAFIPTKGPDLRGVRSIAGDYQINDLSRAMSKGIVIGAAVDEYEQRCTNNGVRLPAVVFTVDILHSQLVTQRFCERGIRAVHVDGDTHPDARRAAIRGLGTGDVNVVSNCSLISEGTNTPAVGAIILLRPTQSIGLHLQQIGRGLRPAPGKAKTYILDHAGNILRHGLPDAPRTWTLEGRCADNEVETEAALALKRCEECGAVNKRAAVVCEECGAPFPVRKLVRPEINTPLIEADPPRFMNYPSLLRWAGADEGRLTRIQIARGYKSGWTFYRLTEARQRISLGQTDSSTWQWDSDWQPILPSPGK